MLWIRSLSLAAVAITNRCDSIITFLDIALVNEYDDDDDDYDDSCGKYIFKLN